MPEALKNLYTLELLYSLSEALRGSYPPFKKKEFLSAVFDKEWANRELKSRMRHISQCVHAFLPISYEKQIEVLKKAAPGFNGFLAMFFPDFVEVYGLEEPDISIPALAHFTQFSSSEFAVRPFIIKYEKRMVKQHLEWAQHKNHHVRRLASEGIRPRLPWAMALPKFKKDPAAILPILERLKQDESEYVRRSVANNLNDISKDHPEVMLQVLKKWKGLGEPTDWILKHASRGLLKKGHAEALGSFGLNHLVKASVNGLKLSRKRLPIGGSFDFTFDVTLHEKKAHDLRIEYKIYFVKSNGQTSAKVFQVGTYQLAPGKTLAVNKSHKFANLTTRKHYPGEHTLAIVVNGKELADLAFHLT